MPNRQEDATDILPKYLTDALWRWFDSAEMAPGQCREPHRPDAGAIEKHLAVPFRLKQRDVISESGPFRALQELKELHRAASLLLNTIDKRLKRAQHSFLSLFRRHGMRSLPYDVIAQIASTIALSYENDCEALEKMMVTLSRFSIFKHCVKHEPAIKQLRSPIYLTPKRSKKFAALIGINSAIITHLDCGDLFMNSLVDFLDMLSRFPGLTYLRIGTSFDLANLVDEDEPISAHTLRIILPHLLQLDVSTKDQWHDDRLRQEDLEYYPYHRQTSSKALRHIMDVISMPKLRTITVSLYDEEKFHSTCSLIDVFGTEKGRRYPSVTDLHILNNTLTSGVFESVGVNHVNMGKFLRQGFPNIRNLTLGHFNITSFVTIMGGEGGTPWHLDKLRLIFEDRLAPGARFGIGVNTATEVGRNLGFLCWESEGITAKQVEVLTKYEENLKIVQRSFPQAVRVTEQSILDMP